MVMLFPDTADRSKNYATTNGQYGNFYGTTIRLKQRDDYDVHYECNKKAAQYASKLEEAKAALELVDWRYAKPDMEGQYAPRGACCLQERRAPHSRCKCNHNTTGCWEDPHQEVMYWDCGPSREPEFLEDHVKCYHPRLAPKHKILAKDLNTRANGCDQGGSAIDVRSRGSRGFGVGLQAGIHSSGGMRRNQRSCPEGNPPLPKCFDILPPSARYGYYRMFGAAGQGAKTSGDFHPRL